MSNVSSGCEGRAGTDVEADDLAEFERACVLVGQQRGVNFNTAVYDDGIRFNIAADDATLNASRSTEHRFDESTAGLHDVCPLSVGFDDATDGVVQFNIRWQFTIKHQLDAIVGVWHGQHHKVIVLLGESGFGNQRSVGDLAHDFYFPS